jgi:hypothetical protein
MIITLRLLELASYISYCVDFDVFGQQGVYDLLVATFNCYY